MRSVRDIILGGHMKHRHTRIAVAAAATLGLTMGATIIGAGSAQAVASTWHCRALSGAGPPNAISGFTCNGLGGGTGWLILDRPNGIDTIEYLCTNFVATQVSTNPIEYDIAATGCTAAPPE
jgi:hypothetical protein